MARALTVVPHRPGAYNILTVNNIFAAPGFL
jgi:hypothetical protein